MQLFKKKKVHSVLRRIDRMANVRISERLPSLLDPDLAAVAYGLWAVPRLVAALQHPDVVSRQRALAALCSLAHDPEKAYQAMRNGDLLCLV